MGSYRFLDLSFIKLMREIHNLPSSHLQYLLAQTIRRPGVAFSVIVLLPVLAAVAIHKSFSMLYIRASRSFRSFSSAFRF